MDRKKIFGREPTLWIALITAVLNWFVGFGWDALSPEQAALINTFINACAGSYAAWTTRPIAPQAFTYAITSLAGLLTAYNLNFSQEMVTSTQFLVLTILALVTRNQVSPAEDAHKTGVLGNEVIDTK